MEEIVKLVMAKTGLPADTARVAVETVVGYFKDRLPGPLAGLIDGVLKGGGNPLGGLGDMLGKR